MTGIISAISGQFSRLLILGTFLPSLLFVLISLILVLPLFPANWQAWQQIQAVDTQVVVAVSLVTVVLAGLLYNLNVPVIRLYEGYTWQHSLIGKWRTGHYRRRLKEALELRPRLQDVQSAFAAAAGGSDPAQNAVNDTLTEGRREAGKRVTTEFPNLDSVLPTRLGNVIRSFEDYPRSQYGMSAIELWPRLIAKIDKDYAVKIDDAKTSLDFMVNCSLLSLFLALLILFVGLWYPSPLAAAGTGLWWLLQILFFLVLSYAFYASSIGRASEWGELVKGAFDLYRRELLTQLGFSRAPESIDEERPLWRTISQQVIYGDTRWGPHLFPFSEPDVSARLTPPPTLRLEVTRGLTPTSADAVFAVTLLVRNADESGRAARDVAVLDKLPEGFELVWDSARMVRWSDPTPGATVLSPPLLSPPGAAVLSPPGTDDSVSPDDAPDYGLNEPRALADGRAALTGTRPLRFRIGVLAHGETAVLRYRVYKYGGK